MGYHGIGVMKTSSNTSGILLQVDFELGENIQWNGCHLVIKHGLKENSKNPYLFEDHPIKARFIYRGFSNAMFDYRTETWGEHKCGMGDERKNGWWLSPQTLKCMNVIGDYHKLSFDCGDNTYWNLRPNGVCMFGLKQQPVLVQLAMAEN